jgi:hypothetical protein
MNAGKQLHPRGRFKAFDEFSNAGKPFLHFGVVFKKPCGFLCGAGKQLDWGRRFIPAVAKTLDEVALKVVHDVPKVVGVVVVMLFVPRRFGAEKIGGRYVACYVTLPILPACHALSIRVNVANAGKTAGFDTVE